MKKKKINSRVTKLTQDPKTTYIRKVKKIGKMKSPRGSLITSGTKNQMNAPSSYGTVRFENYSVWKEQKQRKSKGGVAENRYLPSSRKDLNKILSKRKALVLLHIFYNHPDITLEILHDLIKVPLNVTLYVSLTKGQVKNESTKALIQTLFPKAKFFEVENKGKDIGGKLHMMNHLVEKENGGDFDYMLLAHDKRSPHSAISGDGWRRSLLRGVISGSALHKGFDILENDNNIIGFGSSQWLRGGPTRLISMTGPRAAIPILQKLLKELNWAVPSQFGFVGGTMFWCRYRPMMQFWTKERLDIVISKLEGGDIREPSFTHSTERLFGMILTSFNNKTLLGV